jgi:NAD(P)-dependent dehydrogenase (short-subunit alcohol dehydrogenase family)
MKTAIITGAHGAIGSEIAKGLVGANYRLMLIGRNVVKLKELQHEFESSYGSGLVEYRAVDMSLKDEVYGLADEIAGPLDVLVNNAATAPRLRLETRDGIEMQWATNVLSYFWMTLAFEKHLMKSADGRIVNVASYWAGGLDLEDPEFKHRSYNNDQAYRQSKQANRMMTYGFAALYQHDISVNSCHPGDANSKLSNDLGFGGSMTAEQAARTPVHLATSADVNGITGGYFAHSQATDCAFAADKQAIKKLMAVCAGY